MTRAKIELSIKGITHYTAFS